MFFYLSNGSFALQHTSLEFEFAYPAKQQKDCVAFIARESGGDLAHLVVVRGFNETLDISTGDSTSLIEVAVVGNFDDDDGYEVFVLLNERMQVWDADTGEKLAEREHSALSAWADDINGDGVYEVICDELEGSAVYNNNLARVGTLSGELGEVPKGSYRRGMWTRVVVESGGKAEILEISDGGLPSVTISVNSTRVRKYVEVRANASDPETRVVGLRIYVDNKLYGEVNGSAYTWVVALSPGEHAIGVEAYDVAGNSFEDLVYVTAGVEEVGTPPSLPYVAIIALIAIIVAVAVLLKRRK